MGWANGFRLMNDVIRAIEAHGNLIDQDTGRSVFVEIIKAFEEHDCDTLSDCLGKSTTFDAAYFDVHPNEGGYFAARGGKPITANPYSLRTKKGRAWKSGWEEWRD